MKRLAGLGLTLVLAAASCQGVYPDGEDLESAEAEAEALLAESTGSTLDEVPDGAVALPEAAQKSHILKNAAGTCEYYNGCDGLGPCWTCSCSQKCYDYQILECYGSGTTSDVCSEGWDYATKKDCESHCTNFCRTECDDAHTCFSHSSCGVHR